MTTLRELSAQGKATEIVEFAKDRTLELTLSASNSEIEEMRQRWISYPVIWKQVTWKSKPWCGQISYLSIFFDIVRIAIQVGVNWPSEA